MSVDIAAVGLELEVLTREYLASPEHREEMLLAAKHAERVARELAESELTHSRVHTTKGGYVNEPGDYARSIEGMAVFQNGQWDGRCVARDWKAWWIEDGTKKWPKHSIMLRSAATLRDGDESD